MPLLVYLVGVDSPHVAIGTSAVAVAANAAANLLNHARDGNVKWRCASVFALAGVVGAFFGSTLGKMVEGQKLLALFAVLMMVVSALMLRKRAGAGNPDVRLGRENAFQLVAFGFSAGALSGFFGIGGGFLIVPGLMLATGMPILNAVGSSLVGVTAFGATTATNYALSLPSRFSAWRTTVRHAWRSASWPCAHGRRPPRRLWRSETNRNPTLSGLWINIGGLPAHPSRSRRTCGLPSDPRREPSAVVPCRWDLCEGRRAIAVPYSDVLWISTAILSRLRHPLPDLRFSVMTQGRSPVR